MFVKIILLPNAVRSSWGERLFLNSRIDSLCQRKVKQTFFSWTDQVNDRNPLRDIIEIGYTKSYKSTYRHSYDSMALFETELLRTWY